MKINKLAEILIADLDCEITNTMGTIKIHGKDYAPVSERIKMFREQFPNYALISEITHLNENGVIIRAQIQDDQNRVVATGIAHEVKGSSNINKTSFIENCETSAWGRALANLGLGIDGSIASADEVANAIKQQSYGDTI